VGDGRGTRPEWHRSNASLNRIPQKTIAHGVGYYIMRHRRMAGQGQFKLHAGQVHRVAHAQ